MRAMGEEKESRSQLSSLQTLDALRARDGRNPREAPLRVRLVLLRHSKNSKLSRDLSLDARRRE